MLRVAVIGTGIAGLACSHFLKNHADLTVFERNDYPGGHTNTQEVDDDGDPVSIDTGFMVFNEETYPLLTRLFKELEVTVQPTDMSFSLRNDPEDLEWCGSSLNQLFGQRKNLFSLRFWRFVLELNRFNNQAESDADLHAAASMTVKQYSAWRMFSNDLLDLYLLPMSAAIWSNPADQMNDFPAQTLLRFYKNHRFNSGLKGHLQWMTVTGGAKQYVQKLIGPISPRLQLNKSITAIVRNLDCVDVIDSLGTSQTFDKVIVATHADQALAMLSKPSEAEKQILGSFPYKSNLALLHHDESVMPHSKRCWASWNYRFDQGPTNPLSSTHYWMNRLHDISTKRNYFVSIDGEHLVDQRKVIRRIRYEHPTFSVKAMAAQKRLSELNKRKEERVLFCGSYFRYGFHEDALSSALDLCRQIIGDELWAT